MRPQGLTGRLFGVVMEAINTPAYHFALGLLELEGSEDVLEVGFGTGRMAELLLEHTRGRVVGLDPTPTMVEVALRRRGVRQAGTRAALTLGSDDAIPLAKASFDRALALHAFQFWASPERTLGRLFQILRPRGRLVIVLRDHSDGGADWLPNRLSRGPDEASATERLVAHTGFAARTERDGGMVAVVGLKG